MSTQRIAYIHTVRKPLQAPQRAFMNSMTGDEASSCRMRAVVLTPCLQSDVAAADPSPAVAGPAAANAGAAAVLAGGSAARGGSAAAMCSATAADNAAASAPSTRAATWPLCAFGAPQ